MRKKKLPSSLFTTLSKSLLRDSLTSSGGSETLLLIVMGSSKNKSWLKSALITYPMSTGPIWRILILLNFPSCSRKLVKQPYQSSLPSLKNPSQKRKVFLKLSQSPVVNQWLERSEKEKSTLPYLALQRNECYH